MDTPKHFKHAPCTLKFPHMSAFWTFVKLAQISTFSPIERFRIALQCVQPRALQAPINTRPPRKFAPQNTSTAQGVLVLRVVLIACTTMNVCSPKVLATVRVSPTRLSVLPLFCGCSCAQCWCCAVRCDVRGSRAAWCLGGWHYPPSLAAALPLLGGVAGYVARQTPSFVATAIDVQVGLPLQGDLHLSTQGGLASSLSSPKATRLGCCGQQQQYDRDGPLPGSCYSALLRVPLRHGALARAMVSSRAC